MAAAAAEEDKKGGGIGIGSGRSSMEREGSESDREGGKREVFKFFGIFEDVAESKMRKGVLVKSVCVVDSSADTVFEVLLNLEHQQRYEWDPFTSDLELVESYDGRYDVVCGTYDPKYLSRWLSKRDFVFSRQWFHAQDGTYNFHIMTTQLVKDMTTSTSTCAAPFTH